MSFKKYFFGLDGDKREALATACKTSVGHLRNVAYGKTCRERLAIDLERESGLPGLIEELCPDADWQYVRASGQQNKDRC